MKNKKVLMIVANYFNPDNRVFRAANVLAEKGYDVTLIAKHREGLEETAMLGFGIHLIRIKMLTVNYLPKQIRNFFGNVSFKSKAKEIARNLKPSFVHCHDYNTLFLGLFCKKRFDSCLIYDNHEYFQDLNYIHRYPLFVRKKIARFERNCLKNHVDTMVVVSPGIKTAYGKIYSGRISIIRNIPDLNFDNYDRIDVPEDIVAKLVSMKNKGLKLLLYLGTNTQKGRGLGFAFQLVSRFKDYGLIVFGVKNDQELKYLDQKATQNNICERFHAFAPLKIEQLFSLKNNFSFGLSLIEPIYFSYKHSLPNKLFEYLAMGIPVLSTDIPDQRQFIEKYNVGLALPLDVEKAIHILKQPHEFNDIKLPDDSTWIREKMKYIDLYNALS